MRMPPRRWIVASAGLLVVAAVVLLAIVVQDDGSQPASTTVPEPSPALQEAVLRADVEVDGVESNDLGPIIESLCEDPDPEAVAEQVVGLGVTDPDELREVIEGVGRGAMSLCPAVAAEEPTLLNDVYNAAIAQLDDG